VPPRLRDVVTLPDLGLAVVAGTSALDRPVRWVAVSELEDPGPYLEGGELVLTTGMRLPTRGAALRRYVEALEAAGACALGLGVGAGLTHASPPTGLVAAAEAAGLPLVVVPEGTPFIAVTKAVSRLLSAEEYVEAARGFTAQRELIRAALTAEDGGSAAVVARLARHLGGFALLLDPTGEVVHAGPASAAARAVDLRDEVARLRPQGLLASAALSTAGEYVVLQPLGVRGRARGFLAVGTPGPLRAGDQAVVNLAVSLLSLALSRAEGRSAAERGVRAAALRLLLDGSAADLPLDALGWTAVGTGTLAVAVVRGGVGAVTAAVEDRVSELLPGAAVAAAVLPDAPDLVVALAREPELDALVPGDVLESAGIGDAARFADAESLARSLARARRALAAGGPGVRRYADLGAGLDPLLDPVAADAWAQSLLAPLDQPGERADLAATLHAWLARHGQIDAAAGDLGVHRHTVRHRLRRAEALLGRSLDDPGVRAELWLALARLPEPRS
jgi:purine catabolism regulator